MWAAETLDFPWLLQSFPLGKIYLFAKSISWVFILHPVFESGPKRLHKTRKVVDRHSTFLIDKFFEFKCNYFPKGA